MMTHQTCQSTAPSVDTISNLALEELTMENRHTSSTINPEQARRRPGTPPPDGANVRQTRRADRAFLKALKGLKGIL